MAVEMLGALDLWTLLVGYVFGSFWLAVIGIALVIFVIMGVLGRISIYTVTLTLLLFFLSMTLGYGIPFISMMVTFFLLIAFIFSVKGFIDRGGQ